MAILLALAAALAWGIADFGSGVKSRALPVVVVTLVVFASGGAASLALAAASEGLPGRRTVTFAVLAGLVTSVGVTVFFQALAIGEIGVVAPIVASGTAVPVIVGLVRGERPAAVALAGIALLAIGVVAIVWAPGSGSTAATNARLGVLLAMLSAGVLGLYYVIARSGGAQSPLWYAGLGQLCAALPLLVIALVRRQRLPGRRDLGKLFALGTANGAGWLCSVYALREGLLSLVSVLVALYPAVTVLLAVVVVRERLVPLQYVAGAVILAGVGLVAGGA